MRGRMISYFFEGSGLQPIRRQVITLNILFHSGEQYSPVYIVKPCLQSPRSTHRIYIPWRLLRSQILSTVCTAARSLSHFIFSLKKGSGSFKEYRDPDIF